MRVSNEVVSHSQTAYFPAPPPKTSFVEAKLKQNGSLPMWD